MSDKSQKNVSVKLDASVEETFTVKPRKLPEKGREYQLELKKKETQ